MEARAQVESEICARTCARLRDLKQLQDSIDREVERRTTRETETKQMFQELRNTLLEQQFIDNVLYIQSICENGQLCAYLRRDIMKGLVVWRRLTEVEHRFGSGWFRDWIHSHIAEDLKIAYGQQRDDLRKRVIDILMACGESNDDKIWELVGACLNKENWEVTEFFNTAVMILKVLDYVWCTKSKEDQAKFRNRVQLWYDSDQLKIPEWPLDDPSCCEQLLTWAALVKGMEGLEWNQFYPYLHWSAIRFLFANKEVPEQLWDLGMTQVDVGIMGTTVYNHLKGLTDRRLVRDHSEKIIDFITTKNRTYHFETEALAGVIAAACFGDACDISGLAQLKTVIAKQLPKI